MCSNTNSGPGTVGSTARSHKTLPTQTRWGKHTAPAKVSKEKSACGLSNWNRGEVSLANEKTTNTCSDSFFPGKKLKVRCPIWQIDQILRFTKSSFALSQKHPSANLGWWTLMMTWRILSFQIFSNPWLPRVASSTSMVFSLNNVHPVLPPSWWRFSWLPSCPRPFEHLQIAHGRAWLCVKSAIASYCTCAIEERFVHD